MSKCASSKRRVNRDQSVKFREQEGAHRQTGAFSFGLVDRASEIQIGRKIQRPYSCAFRSEDAESHDRMILPDQAQTIILGAVTALPAERRALDQLAGATLRQEVRATRDQPPFDRVTMDGIALAHDAYAQGVRKFRIAGTQAAGAPPKTLEDPHSCIEVMTGAMIPHGCDCVVPVERISLENGYAHLTPDIAVVAHQNIHGRALDCQVGEPLLAPGVQIGPAEVAVLASAGLSRVLASRSPRIAVISTGDELVEPGQDLEPWQIYRSNAYAIAAGLRCRGFEHITHDHLPDDLQTLRDRLGAHLERHDALILSGGVSMGRFDYVPQVLQELGVKTLFHKIAQRPGKPMWFGVGGAGQSVYALPGNPVSTLVCLSRYVFAGLRQAQGQSQQPPLHVTLDRDFEVRPALHFFLPVRVERQGTTHIAEPRPTKGSGDFTSLLGTDGFVELPPGPTLVSAGTAVPFYRW